MCPIFSLNHFRYTQTPSRSRQALSNAYLDAKIGVDTAENEPSKVWGMVDRFQKLDFRSQSGALSYRELRTAKGHHLWSRKLGPTCFDHKIQNSSKSTNLSLGHRCLKYNSTRSRCWCKKKKVKRWFWCRNKPKLCDRGSSSLHGCAPLADE